MTQDKKSYTNADIIKRLDIMDSRLNTLEVWKVAQDAGKAAVDEYRRQETSDAKARNNQSITDTIKEITPYVIAVLAALAAVIYFHTGGK